MISFSNKANIGRKLLLYLIFAFSLSFASSELKIQLDENFSFIGKESYDQSFIYEGLDDTFKDYIYTLLKSNYAEEIIEVRLNEMYDEYGIDISKNKYIYLKANISKVNRVVYNIGGDFNIPTSPKNNKSNNNMETENLESSSYKFTQTILSITGGIEFYDLKTGELFYTNVFTIGSRVKRKAENPLTQNEVSDIYKNDALKLFKKLITQASKEYNPGISEATILDDYGKNNWIINKGTNDGFDIGKTVFLMDGINNLDIIEASPTIALLEADKNSSVKYKNKKVQLFINKNSNKNSPKVLVNQVEFIESYMFDDNLDYDKSTITQWFKDYLSTYCNFYIVPSDPEDIYNFQKEVEIRGNTSSKELISQLIKPDYIIYPKIIYAYNVNDEGGKSVMGQTSISTLNVLLELQLIDVNTGIILKSIRQKSTNSQEQTENLTSVDMTELFPSVIKDGIITMCEKLGNEFSISKVEAKLKKNKKSFELKYTTEQSFKHGQILYVYRSKKDVKDKNGDIIGYLEERIGRIRIIEKENKSFAKPLYGNLTLKNNDIIRDYVAPDILSENTVTFKIDNTTDISAPKIISTVLPDCKEPQEALPIDLIVSNYYDVISNNKKLTPILDEKNQLFLKELRKSFSGAFYKANSDESKDITPKYYSDIKSLIIDKIKVNDSRIDIKYALRLRLFENNNAESPIHESVKGIELILGDKKKSKGTERKRSKKNIIIKGLTEQDVNKKFFETNKTLFKQTSKVITENL